MAISNRIAVFFETTHDRRLPIITSTKTSAGPVVDMRQGGDLISFHLHSREDVARLVELAEEGMRAWDEFMAPAEATDAVA